MTRYIVTERTSVDANSEDEAIEKVVNCIGGDQEVMAQDAEPIEEHEVDEPTTSYWDHPDLSDWQYEVANGDTLRGFAEWLTHERR